MSQETFPEKKFQFTIQYPFAILRVMGFSLTVMISFPFVHAFLMSILRSVFGELLYKYQTDMVLAIILMIYMFYILVKYIPSIGKYEIIVTLNTDTFRMARLNNTYDETVYLWSDMEYYKATGGILTQNGDCILTIKWYDGKYKHFSGNNTATLYTHLAEHFPDKKFSLFK